jgi:predicted TIM-barrel fold metal-dependent hydrolase
MKEMGFVGAIVNPDPAGDRQTPGMNTEYWFPLYEKGQALQAPLIVHPSISRDPRVEIIPNSYQYNNLTEETLATLLMEHSNIFELFPNLKIIIFHCGGALSRFVTRIKRTGGGGQVGVAVRRRERAARDVSRNLFFDTCAYDKDFLAIAIRQRGVDRMLFGTEAPGTGTAVINPDTGKPSDDLVPLIDSIEFLTPEDKRKIFYDNPKRVFSLLKVQ